MRAAAFRLLSIALRWLVTISTASPLVDDGGQIGRVLHQPRNVGAHGQHAMMQARQQVHDPLRVVAIEHLAGPFGRLYA